MKVNKSAYKRAAGIYFSSKLDMLEDKIDEMLKLACFEVRGLYFPHSAKYNHENMPSCRITKVYI